MMSIGLHRRGRIVKPILSQLDITDLRDFVLIALFVATLAIGCAIGAGA